MESNGTVLDQLLKEYEKDLDSIYTDKNGKQYTFAGLLYASDDYYFAMVELGTGILHRYSCVSSLKEGFGFKKILNPRSLLKLGDPKHFDCDCLACLPWTY